MLVAMLRWYRDAVSPALPPRCRFYPSCSTYALTAVAQYGATRGGWLALRRVLRCGPWHPGGVDPVPSIVDERTKDVGPQRRPLAQESAVV